MAKDIKLSDNVTFTDNSEEVKAAVAGSIARALDAMGMQAEKYAKGLCPVDTGRLRNSITHTFSGAGAMTKTYQDTGSTKDRRKGHEGQRISTVQSSFGTMIGSAENDHTMTVWIGTNVEYAPYVELGVPSKGRKAKPYLKPAVRDHASEYKSIAESYLKKS